VIFSAGDLDRGEIIKKFTLVKPQKICRMTKNGDMYIIYIYMRNFVMGIIVVFIGEFRKSNQEGIHVYVIYIYTYDINIYIYVILYTYDIIYV